MGITTRNRPQDIHTPRPTGVSGTTPAPPAAAPVTTTPAPRTDAFDRVRDPTPPSVPLPDVLMDGAGVKVFHGTDPGDFYCEHMFFVTQQHALKADSGAVKNKQGEVLVGFLHVPMDDHTQVENGTYDQATRHAGNREVVGAALRGYLLDAMAGVPAGPVRLMLNGYETFMYVKDNPTGSFASHAENVDAAMRRAFGTHLLTPAGKPLQDHGGHVLEYRVKDPQSGQERAVQIHARSWPVTDETIGAGPTSVQTALETFRPHAVLSMGVASDRYLAEWNADDGGMRTGPSPAHDGSRSPTTTLPENRSLARAIVRGNQPLQPMNLLAAFGARTGPLPQG